MSPLTGDERTEVAEALHKYALGGKVDANYQVRLAELADKLEAEPEGGTVPTSIYSSLLDQRGIDLRERDEAREALRELLDAQPEDIGAVPGAGGRASAHWPRGTYAWDKAICRAGEILEGVERTHAPVEALRATTATLRYLYDAASHVPADGLAGSDEREHLDAAMTLARRHLEAQL